MSIFTTKTENLNSSTKGIGGIRQVLYLCIGFVSLSLLLNATGIRLWAERIEIQDSWIPRTELIELSKSWENFIEPTGLNLPRAKIIEWRARQEITDQKSEDQKSELMTSAKESSNAKGGSEDGQDLKNFPGKNEAGVDSLTLKNNQAIPHVNAKGYIALTGDSMMAVSFGPNLAKFIERNSDLKVIRAYKSGTGLSRPDVFNWLVEYPKFLAGRSPAVVICAIGANDAQGFQVDKKVISFGTQAWDEEYARRAEAFIDLMLKNGSKVYWVLLPHMRSPVYSQKMQNLNQFLENKFKNTPNLFFISPDELMVGKPVKSYVEFSPGEHQKMDRLRGDDGIHLSEMGGQRLARGIWALVSASMPKNAANE